MPSVSSGKTFREHLVSREIVARALWAAFPSRSLHELCIKAAPVLDCSPETVRRMAMQETDARLRNVWPILAMGAASKGIDLIEAIGAD